MAYGGTTNPGGGARRAGDEGWGRGGSGRQRDGRTVGGGATGVVELMDRVEWWGLEYLAAPQVTRTIHTGGVQI